MYTIDPSNVHFVAFKCAWYPGLHGGCPWIRPLWQAYSTLIRPVVALPLLLLPLLYAAASFFKTSVKERVIFFFKQKHDYSEKNKLWNLTWNRPRPAENRWWCCIIGLFWMKAYTAWQRWCTGGGSQSFSTVDTSFCKIPRQ